MLELLKTLILDSQEAFPSTGVPRRIGLQRVAGKAAVCIGVRRAGKSTYLQQIIERLAREGVPRQNTLFLNFFDDRLHGLTAERLGLVLDAYYSLYPEKRGEETVHCFFDEIQAVAGWEPFVDRLLRTERCDVYLTGSSAHMLSKEIATQMRGRALSWELFPFSFRELLDGRGLASTLPAGTKSMTMLRAAFDDYWRCGEGFPEVSGLPDDLRVRTHQEYLQAVLFRDVVERHDVSHPRAISDLVHHFLNNCGSLYTINRAWKRLRALGHKVPKSSVTDWIAWMEDAYFLFSVPIFDASHTRRMVNPRKIYCVDHALVTSVSSGLLVNSGHLLENLVFVALRRNYPEIYYVKTSSGREVDFVVAGRARRVEHLIQVCESLASEDTRERETTALFEAMSELDVDVGTIVTRNDAETIERGGAQINVVPAWRFLLQVDPVDAS